MRTLFAFDALTFNQSLITLYLNSGPQELLSHYKWDLPVRPVGRVDLPPHIDKHLGLQLGIYHDP